MVETYSLLQIQSQDFKNIDPLAYSRFKFGDGIIAKDFGKKLATGFAETHLASLPPSKQILVLSYRYPFITTASSELAHAFIKELNRYLANDNRPVAQEAHIIRQNTYYTDYCGLTDMERRELIREEKFHIDVQMLKNKLLLFIDDIRITGSHQFMVEKRLKSENIENDRFYIYYAVLENEKLHPNTENFLNHYAVKEVKDLSPILASQFFKINARFIKFILRQDLFKIKQFLENQPEAITGLIYDHSLGNNYHKIDEFKPALELIQGILGLGENLHNGQNT